MREPEDWRLTNQERYLRGVTLVWRSYSPENPENDHDHCAFCSDKFMVSEPGTLHEGWSTEDRYRWICATCCDDFQDLFHWNLCHR
jgi:hypothetical protein